MDYYLIFWGVASWLIIAEIVYIFFMRKEKDMSCWGGIKFVSLFGSIILGIFVFAIYSLFKDYAKPTLMAIGLSLLVYLYLRTNYDIGKYIVKKNKKFKRVK